MLNVLEKVNIPLDIENFSLLDNSISDSLFYGIVLRNEFDIDRVTINKKYSPCRFYTIAKHNDGFEILYFYGSFIKVIPEYKELITNLNTFSDIRNHNIISYQKILSLYGVNCENTFRYFSNGIYPIDSDYREKLFSTKNNFHKFFKAKKDLPFFLTIVSPVIIYFSNPQNNISNFKKFLAANTKP